MAEAHHWCVNASSVFAGISERDKDEIASKLTHQRIKKKNYVYIAGDAADTLYILTEGRIKITRHSEEGKELTVEILEVGDVFGELALGAEEVRASSAEVLEDAVICAIHREDFEKFISTRADFSLAITKWIGGRMKRIEARLENLIFRDVRSRLLNLLRELADRYGTDIDGGRKITLRLSHQDIANLIGATRETVTLELNNLKRSGTLLVDGKEYVLPDDDEGMNENGPG